MGLRRQPAHDDAERVLLPATEAPEESVRAAAFSQLGATYGRARTGFNYSITGDANMRIFEALAAGAGGPFADAVGVYKEVDDSRRGSGFSFADLDADRDGTRFGEAATASAASARRVQALARTGLRESDVMVAARDLPEAMPEAEFKRRFGGVDAPAYARMIAEIDGRIAALPAYR